MRIAGFIGCVVVAVAAVSDAHAQPDPLAPDEPQPPPAERPPDVAAPIPPVPEIDPKIGERVDDLDGRQEELDRRMRKLEKDRGDIAHLREQMAGLSRYIVAFVDVGAFVVGGDGSGIRSDALHVHYPEYRNTVPGQWVFMGDPFSTAINALGEPADTADSREVTTDTVNSSGRPSLIVNSVGLEIAKDIDIDDRPAMFGVHVLAQLLPRPGPDILDIETAYVIYRPLEETGVLQVQAGKIDSVLGVEYRAQDARRRLTVTPSLLCRYLCGRPFGVSGRYYRGAWNVSAAVTNGDNFEERFEPHQELKANRIPTVSGHVQWKAPIGKGLELGVSGAFGPQDNQSNTSVHQWHYGIDVNLFEYAGWQVTAEFAQGKQQGSTFANLDRDAMTGEDHVRCDVASCLTYKGAYVLVDKLVNDRLTPYVRFDWRTAVHEQGADFVYQAHTLRSTIGANFKFGSRVQAKIEYTYNHEMGVPSFPHDILTSSVVVATD
jgi:putative OmpL-like beta-barrel porin-2